MPSCARARPCGHTKAMVIGHQTKESTDDYNESRTGARARERALTCLVPRWVEEDTQRPQHTAEKSLSLRAGDERVLGMTAMTRPFSLARSVMSCQQTGRRCDHAPARRP